MEDQKTCADLCQAECKANAEGADKEALCGKKCERRCEQAASEEAFACQQGCVMACEPDEKCARCGSTCLIACSGEETPTDPARWNECLSICRDRCFAEPEVYMRWQRLANDGRGRFSATAYTGIGIDSFAAGEVNDYINADQSGKVKVRGVAGFDFAYRLMGNKGARQQVWVYGETIHGVRSADLDCGPRDPNNPSPPGSSFCDPDNPNWAGNRTLFILRNATSLEAFVGLRWEFLRLQKRWSPHPASLYFKVQAGFLTVSGKGGDIVDAHEGALGVIATNGRFQDSYLEAGYGRMDLFLVNATRRIKVGGFLTWRPGDSAERRPLVQPFAKITVDADCGPGADSIQTYVGILFDLDNLDVTKGAIFER